MRKCLNCDFVLTKHYPVTAKLCAECAWHARGPHYCNSCGQEHRNTWFRCCERCHDLRLYAEQALKTYAAKIMSKAIRKGLLPKAQGQKCVDCDKPAHGYDHRYYTRPLEVVPVCRSCNSKRGCAIDLREAYDRINAAVRISA